MRTAAARWVGNHRDGLSFAALRAVRRILSAKQQADHPGTSGHRRPNSKSRSDGPLLWARSVPGKT